MAGLDDPRMYRPDRYLMQALALGAEEGVRRPMARPRRSRRSSGLASVPTPMIQPRPRVGQANRREAEEIASRSARSAAPADESDRRKDSGRPDIRWSHDGDRFLRLVEEGHVDGAATSPHRPSSAHRPSARREASDCHKASSATIRGHGRCASIFRPRATALARDGMARPTLRARRHAGTIEPAAAADRRLRSAPESDGRTSARRRPATAQRPASARRRPGLAGAG